METLNKAYSVCANDSDEDILNMTGLNGDPLNSKGVNQAYYAAQYGRPSLLEELIKQGSRIDILGHANDLMCINFALKQVFLGNNTSEYCKVVSILKKNGITPAYENMTHKHIDDLREIYSNA